MRVLLADDSRVSRRVLSQMISAWGYEVVQCEDGTQAWEALRAPDAPRIAILDWVMPGIDGIDLVRRLRTEDAEHHVFLFLLTARTSQEDMLAGLEAGADDYLTKPANPAELKVRLRNGARIVALQEELLKAKEELRTQALHDPLTDAWNRRALETIATAELARCRRHLTPAALLLLDLDHFKSVNDTYGHAAGDLVLKETARRIRAAMRQGDELARFGGEEFVVLLPRCSPEGVIEAGERVRRAICATPIKVGDIQLDVSASVGAARFHPADELSNLVERADAALYTSKREGRNRTTVADDLADRLTLAPTGT